MPQITQMPQITLRNHRSRKFKKFIGLFVDEFKTYQLINYQLYKLGAICGEIY